VCNQLVSKRIQKADVVVPRATSTVASVWTRFDTRPCPNSVIPRKVALRKKAVSTS